jgi:signal-transduction protein with cAMP-binding, CBS, and nucleotidyltransferase domain
MKTGYRVSDIMTANPIKIDEEETVQRCAETMVKNGLGSIIVIKKDKFVGIVTEEDLVQKIVVKDIVASTLKVKKIMTPLKDIISIEPDKDLHDAMIMMKENDVRRLPVVKGNVLHGLITTKDVLRIQPDLFELVVDTYDLREMDRKGKYID